MSSASSSSASDRGRASVDVLRDSSSGIPHSFASEAPGPHYASVVEQRGRREVSRKVFAVEIARVHDGFTASLQELGDLPPEEPQQYPRVVHEVVARRGQELQQRQRGMLLVVGLTFLRLVE